MSGSPKPSAPAGILSPASAVEIPAGLFFEAGDYNELNTHPGDLVAVRSKVARHRSKLKAMVALQLEDLARINTSLHAADRQGNAAPHWDSAIVLLAKIQASVETLADQIDKAESRYENSVLASPVELMEKARVAPGSLMAGSSSVRPSKLAERVRKSA